MSISSTVYIGTTGVIAHQENMSVISDNIANMNTVGFKSSRLLFNNLLSQELAGASVNNQVGRGVGLSSTLYNMSAGALESTNTATDIAIGGIGFFVVSPENSDAMYYTRAGNFRFDETGYLRDPRGNILQGYKMPPDSLLGGAASVPPASSAPLEDIRLNIDDQGMTVSEPETTTEISMMINLDSSSEDQSISTTSPFTALFDAWDAQNNDPLGSASYAYSSSLRIYDSNGNPHVVTAFFDPATNVTDQGRGYRTWEFLLTVPPAEDASALNIKKGVLMTGTLTFSPSGDLYNMSAFQGTSDDKNTWTPVTLSPDGYPVFTATLAGSEPISTSLNLGVRASATGWVVPPATTSLADLSTSFSSVPTMHNPEKQTMSLTNYNTGFSTLYQSQNGYERGYLESISVSAYGLLVGKYSNGQEQLLFKIPLADFINPQELFREGGNLFSATKKSGASTLGWAGEGRLGRMAGRSLENSNVDLASEFVDMIITQRGFDANSKSITTGDQVVQTAIQMKR